MRDDLEYVEDHTESEMRQFKTFLNKTKRKSLTILELGAGPAQPLARTMARDRYLNDKYHVTLISINPRKERTAQYEWEKEKFETLHSQYEKKQHQMALLERYKEEVAETERRLNVEINELSSRYDIMDRADANSNA